MKTMLATAAVTAAALAAPAFAQVVVGGAPMLADRTIAENASQADNLTTLVAAVQAADMAGTLSGPGPFTVFAPTNAAFDRISDGSLEALLAPENKAQLQQVLGCHVVAAEAFAGAIRGMVDDDGGAHAVSTVGGCTLTATYDGDRIMLTDENDRTATVVIGNVDQANGVVHVIDRVLLPAQ